MQYLGGKAKIAKYLVQYLESVRKPHQIYAEPFVGGANVISKMSGRRYAYDYNEYLIELYKAVQKGYEPPDNIDEKEYKYIKEHKDENKALTAFVGFGCSFAGKWFDGYARNASGRNYALSAKNSLNKKMKTMQDVIFACSDYKDLTFENCLIYCDPPYKNTRQTYGVGKFNSDKFWEFMRIWSLNNDVYISEYVAPDDFICVWERENIRYLRKNDSKKVTEKLFKYNNT